MVDRLMRFVSRRTAAFCGAAALACFQGGALGEILPDPTRPPAALDAPQAADAGTAPARAPQLQTVVLPKQGKPLAVIGGEIVPLGGKFGEQRLVRVDEREIVLEGPKGREVLRLTPEIEKKAVVPAAHEKATRRKRPQQGGEKQ